MLRFADFSADDEPIGSGAFGDVYRGRDERTARDVAIKVLRPGVTDRETFLAEARIAGTIAQGCPHIATVFYVGDSPESFIVREFVAGSDLRKWVKTHRWPDLQRAVHIIAHIAEALIVSHKHNVTHCDIKPENIIIAEDDGRAVLVDFGIGATFNGEIRSLAGTPRYMAPEQFSDRRRGFHPQADIFSLGVVFYELLTQKLPYPDPKSLIAGFDESGDSRGTETALDHFASPPPPMRTYEDIPPELERICRKCLEVDPEDRYASVRDLSNDLRRWMHQTNRPARRISPFVMTIAAVGCLLGTMLWAGRSTRDDPFDVVYYRDDFSRPFVTKKHWEFPLLPRPTAATISPPTVEVRDGVMFFLNRGYAVSRDTFDDGISLQFQWMWARHTGTYSDDLTIALRTTGQPAPKWSHEVLDGITVRFSSETGQVAVRTQPSGAEIAVADGIIMARAKWHTIKIVDFGDTISVFFDDLQTPVIRTTLPPDAPKQGRIAIYNREAVAGVDKESFLDDLEVRVR